MLGERLQLSIPEAVEAAEAAEAAKKLVLPLSKDVERVLPEHLGVNLVPALPLQVL